MNFSKLILCLIMVSALLSAQAQSLPIDFENTITTADFTDFDGGTASVIANPQVTGLNTSASVAQIVRNGGQVWAGSKIDLAAPLDFSSQTQISMKVFTTAPVGTTVKFKLEGNGSTELDVPTTVSNEWEILTWDFTGEPMNFNSLVFMFDFGKLGDSSQNSTFLFDDIVQINNGIQLDLPVDFENNTVNYYVQDFGGNISRLVSDPTNPNNQVIRSIKTGGAVSWAGTTIGTNAGFISNIPLSLTESNMTVRVWSPAAGIPIRLKVEDANDPTHTCETETLTTVAGEWEVLTFDFLNEAPGTAQLSLGLNMGWTYNMASIFFNFGTDGAVAGEQTYYFDDVAFGDVALGVDDQIIAGLSAFPNPGRSHWTIQSASQPISVVELFDVQGRQILSMKPETRTITFPTPEQRGIYFAKVTVQEGFRTFRLVKE
ncbi:MAG: T9SS type A sorting domain-containing protein [Bacteroidota bacterium]